MRRDPRLHGLSEEHHAALVAGRKIDKAVQAGELEAARVLVLETFEAVAPHFRVEEALLLPALEALGETELVDRTRADHDALAALRDKVHERVSGALEAFTIRLVGHIRFEERVLFPTVERELDDGVLEAIGRGRSNRASVDPFQRP